MRFCLVYRGPLSATQNKPGKRRDERVEIRKQITPQLKRLWEVSEPLIRLQTTARVPKAENGIDFYGASSSPLDPGYRQAPKLPVSEGFVDLSAPFEKHGKKFRPLVRADLDLTCSLEILFLRQESPGSLLKKAGDLDNRIKTFIDALEMPTDQLDGDETDDVNYRLLENDSLVRGIEIDSERLLLPENDFPNQVHLVAEIVVHVEMVGPWNVCLL